jgi:hypothetical protein
MSQNAIIGDSYSIDLPETQVDQELLEDEKKRARFSKTAEFKRLKEYIDSRMAFYQNWLPDGRDVQSVNIAEMGQQWVVANAVIAELHAVIDMYEQAKEAIQDGRS